MISIIIPTYNEEVQISKTVKAVLENCIDKDEIEIIIADGQSTDDTLASIKYKPITFITCPTRGRAAQMNCGATKAKYFFFCMQIRNLQNILIRSLSVHYMANARQVHSVYALIMIIGS